MQPDTHDGSGHTGDETSGQVDHGQLRTDELVLGLSGSGDDLLLGDLEDGELGHGVRDLLEEDGSESTKSSGKVSLGRGRL